MISTLFNEKSVLDADVTVILLSGFFFTRSVIKHAMFNWLNCEMARTFYIKATVKKNIILVFVIWVLNRHKTVTSDLNKMIYELRNI